MDLQACGGTHDERDGTRKCIWMMFCRGLLSSSSAHLWYSKFSELDNLKDVEKGAPPESTLSEDDTEVPGGREEEDPNIVGWDGPMILKIL
jgi:hypothetical protein